VNFVTFVVIKKPSWLFVLFVTFVVAACGKKGPPLAPIVRIPAAVDKIQAQRVGSDAFITLTVPAKNIDSTIPVDIDRIEVYGYTGRRPPPNTRWVEYGELVATIPVIPPPPPDAPPADATQPADLTKGARPGTLVTVLDTLTPQKLVQGKVEEPATSGRGRKPNVPDVAASPDPDVLRRFYIAIGFSVRGRPGPGSTAAEFPLIDAPEPPAFVSARYSETTVTVEWPPSGGIVGSLFDSALPPEDPPLDEVLEPIVTAPAAAANAAAAVPAGPVKYNLYRELAPDPLALPDPTGPVPWAQTPPMPINPAPLSTMTFTDSVEFDRERCYVVRAVRGTPPDAIEGDPSAPNCFIPVDIFPPAAPARLVAVADAGGISLIWEPNAEPDVIGYLVLRAEASDATLQPLTPTPVAEPRFRDTHVTAGKKYVYAVLALDSRVPLPNVSAESSRVEETAR
jgi:predicted small lipoprotein YifL